MKYESDEYTGQGGSYVRDPITGKRRPAEQEQIETQDSETETNNAFIKTAEKD